MVHKYMLLANGCTFACMHSALTLVNKIIMKLYFAPGKNWQIQALLFPTGDWTSGLTGRHHESLSLLPASLTTADLFMAPAPSPSWRMTPWLPTLIGGWRWVSHAGRRWTAWLGGGEENNLLLGTLECLFFLSHHSDYPEQWWPTTFSKEFRNNTTSYPGGIR